MTNIKKTLACIMAIIMILVCGVSCANSNNKENIVENTPPIEEFEGDGTYLPEVTSPPIVYPFTFEDNTGYSVTLEQEPLTVVTIGPDITEIMFAIGRGIQIEGRSEEDNYPYDVTDIQSIGSINNPDPELIAKIEPDVVIASDKVPAEKIAEIRNKQIPTVVVKTPQSFEEIYDTIRYIGRVLNAEKAAYSYAIDLQGRVSEVLINNTGNEKYKICIVTDYSKENGTVTTTKSDPEKYKYYEDIFGVLGLNVVDINEDPYYIICLGEELMVRVESSDALQEISAVKMSRVRSIEEELFEKRGPRSLNTVYVAAELIGYQLGVQED